MAWNEEGHRFSWRMKLRSKKGSGSFYVYADGKKWKIRPRKYLSKKQTRKVACIPDIALQFAHYLGDTWASRGYKDIKVTTDVLCSLNGRRQAPLINPDVNLYAQKRNLSHADWILPLTEPLQNPWLDKDNG